MTISRCLPSMAYSRAVLPDTFDLPPRLAPCFSSSLATSTCPLRHDTKSRDMPLLFCQSKSHSLEAGNLRKISAASEFPCSQAWNRFFEGIPFKGACVAKAWSSLSLSLFLLDILKATNPQNHIWCVCVCVCGRWSLRLPVVQ